MANEKTREPKGDPISRNLLALGLLAQSRLLKHAKSDDEPAAQAARDVNQGGDDGRTRKPEPGPYTGL